MVSIPDSIHSPGFSCMHLLLQNSLTSRFVKIVIITALSRAQPCHVRQQKMFPYVSLCFLLALQPSHAVTSCCLLTYYTLGRKPQVEIHELLGRLLYFWQIGIAESQKVEDCITTLFLSTCSAAKVKVAFGTGCMSKIVHKSANNKRNQPWERKAFYITASGHHNIKY